MRCCDQGAHIRERLTANRSDLTLQGGPNQHDMYLPRRTIHDNHSPPRLELQEPAQRHKVSRAQRETTKSKYMHPKFSTTIRLAPGFGCGFLYFRSKTVLGLPVSTTSYSRHAASTVQTWSAGLTTARSLTDTDGTTLPSLPGLRFYSFFHSKTFIHI